MWLLKSSLDKVTVMSIAELWMLLRSAKLAGVKTDLTHTVEGHWGPGGSVWLWNRPAKVEPAEGREKAGQRQDVSQSSPPPQEAREGEGKDKEPCLFLGYITL